MFYSNSTSRAFNELSDSEFRDLSQKMTFFAIAIRFNISERTVSIRAKKANVVPYFSRNSGGALSNEEKARILKLRDGGESFENIAKEINRSPSCVGEMYLKIKAGGGEDKRKLENKEPSLPWPVPDTEPLFALAGRVYDDIPKALLEKEAPSHRKPIDGRFFTRRAYIGSEIGCSALLCSES